jgi:hypothetical protein
MVAKLITIHSKALDYNTFCIYELVPHFCFAHVSSVFVKPKGF